MPRGANITPAPASNTRTETSDIAGRDQEAASRPERTNDRYYRRSRISEVLDHFDHGRGIEGTWRVIAFIQWTHLNLVPTGSSFSAGNRCDFLALSRPAHVTGDIEQ